MPDVQPDLDPVLQPMAQLCCGSMHELSVVVQVSMD